MRHSASDALLDEDKRNLQHICHPNWSNLHKGFIEHSAEVQEKPKI